MLNKLFFFGDVAYTPTDILGSGGVAFIILGLVIIALIIAIVIVKKKNRRK